jgi:hypothetical protein
MSLNSISENSVNINMSSANVCLGNLIYYLICLTICGIKLASNVVYHSSVHRLNCTLSHIASRIKRRRQIYLERNRASLTFTGPLIGCRFLSGRHIQHNRGKCKCVMILLRPGTDDKIRLQLILKKQEAGFIWLSMSWWRDFVNTVINLLVQ